MCWSSLPCREATLRAGAASLENIEYKYDLHEDAIEGATFAHHLGLLQRAPNLATPTTSDVSALQ